VSAGEIAGLIAAGAFVLLVLLLAVPLLKLGRTLDEATLTIRQTREAAAPLLASAQDTVTAVNSQLGQVEAITKDVNSMTTNAAALTSVASATLGSPLIKLAAFSYGVRRTFTQRRDSEAIKTARTERSARSGRTARTTAKRGQK
jgi:uncharacterized protein YoxC